MRLYPNPLDLHAAIKKSNNPHITRIKKEEEKCTSKYKRTSENPSCWCRRGKKCAYVGVTLQETPLGGLVRLNTKKNPAQPDRCNRYQGDQVIKETNVDAFPQLALISPLDKYLTWCV